MSKINHIDIINEHLYIRETVGYNIIKEVPTEDLPKVIEFLQIVWNYNKMSAAIIKK